MTDIVGGALRCLRVAPIATMLTIAVVASSADAQTRASAIDPTAAPSDQQDFSVLLDAPADISSQRPPAPPSNLAAASAPIGRRVDKADGSMMLTAGQRLATPWDAKVGVDVAAPAAPGDAPLPGQASEDHGAGWADLAMPAAPIGLDKATIDARVDPSADQGRLSTALARAVPLGGGVSLTLQNGYSVTQSLANPNGIAAPNARVYSGDGGVKLELPTATALSAGARMSSIDDRPMPSLSAEQKLFGTPLSITGTISQRPTGATDRSITAGFRRTW